MRYSLKHTTSFNYSAPIREGVTELRLQPRSELNQRCLSFSVITRPNARIFAYRDGLGNTVQYFDIPGRHNHLDIVSEAAVEVLPPAWIDASATAKHIVPGMPLPPLPPDAWERLNSPEVPGLHFDDLNPSRFPQFTPALRHFDAELELPTDADPLSLVLAMTSRIYGLFEYDSDATRVDSPIDEPLMHRRGVCQDYSHVMLALCRLHGLPARYVSGYLYTGSNSGDRSSPDASHAWVEVWLPTIGWAGFDPTNNLVAGERHIRVAVGRDYADVPPVRGVFKGGAKSKLTVAVEVNAVAPEPPDVVIPAANWPPTVSGELRHEPGMPGSNSAAAQQEQQQQ